MIFNSLAFLVFFPAVTLIYFLLPSLRWRNMFLLIASYYFYMNWKPEYALLLFTSTFITYLASLGIERYERHKKLWVTLSAVSNLSILFFFKYYNWLGANITAGLQSAGLAIEIPHLDILLPVGISFYTFQALGYTIDAYRKDVKVERNFFRYALFVSFFPQLVAGPIERSTNLLQQFYDKRSFDYANFMPGLNLMLWGYFMKLVVADRCALYVDAVFNNPAHHNGGSFLLASILFTFQIYGDFAGYTYIAIGAARIMGFKLHDNFRRPYFATTITEFWHRWHISLSTCFRDYVYIPMGGSRKGNAKTYRNILLTFLLSGIWHGANWTFVLWGTLHGLIQCIERAFKWPKQQFAGLSRVAHYGLTMSIVVLAWLLFRADSIQAAWWALTQIFTNMAMPFVGFNNPTEWALVLLGVSILMVKEIIDERGINFHLSQSKSWLVRHTYALGMMFVILLCGVLEGGQFIYFQF